MEKVVSRSAPARQWIDRILLVVVAFLGLLAAAGFLYENICEVRDRRFHPMQGQLVDVGGRKMHIHCTGDGSPAVILDSGLGDSYLSWSKVQPQVAKFARVCSYDRAGLGFSDSSPGPRTSKVIARSFIPFCRAQRFPLRMSSWVTPWGDITSVFSPAGIATKLLAWFS